MILSILFIITYNPLISHAADNGEKEVIIGYENNAGKQLVIENSSEIDYQFNQVSAIAVSIDQGKLDELKRNPNITYIENNVPISLSNRSQNIEEIFNINQLAETERWNIQSTSGPAAWELGFTGKNVNIAVIDTGISPHSDLRVSGGYSTIDSTTEWTDDNGHGTHVAGIISSERNDFGVVGVAPGANIYSVKALDSDGEGTLDDLLEAIEWSIQNEMDIINLSLGTNYESSTLQTVIDKAYNAGILIVGASGNDSEGNSVLYPAKYENVIGVSAVDENFNITSFSSTGTEVEFSAPGVNVVSTFLGESYGKANGTSQASPHVTGMLALLKQKNPELTSVELRTELVNYVQDLGEPGRDLFYGHGFVNFNPDVKAPGEVTNLQAREITTGTITFSWLNPSEEDFLKTNVYLNDKFIKSINFGEKATYNFKGLDPDTAYTVTIHTEDRFGNISKGVTQAIKTEAIENTKKEIDRSEESPELETQEKDKTSKEQPDQQVKTENDEKARPEKQMEQKTEEEELVVSQPNSKNQTKSEEVNNINPWPSTEKPKKQYDSVDLSDVDQEEKDEKEKPTEDTRMDEVKKDTTKNIETTSLKEDTEIEETAKKDSKKENIIVRFFSSLAKIFITITDWLVGLFS